MVDQASEGLLSPYLRRKRIAAAEPWLKGRVLDVGCGTGNLARLIEPELYMGVDRDAWSITAAQEEFPGYEFRKRMPLSEEKFDTVVALAVIEHVPDPGKFLRELAFRLETGAGARLVCTTPHPSVDWLHNVGATLGLFSRHANEEHENLLDYSRLKTAGLEAGLDLVEYSRFLFGANQLAVFQSTAEQP